MKFIKKSNAIRWNFSRSEWLKIGKLAKWVTAGLEATPGGQDNYLPTVQEFFGKREPDPYEYFVEVIYKQMKNRGEAEKAIRFMEEQFQDPAVRKFIWERLTEDLKEQYGLRKISPTEYSLIYTAWESMLNPKTKAQPAKPKDTIHTDIEDVTPGEPLNMEFIQPQDLDGFRQRVTDEIAQTKAKILQRFQAGEITSEQKYYLLEDLDRREAELKSEFAKAKVSVVTSNGKQFLRFNRSAWRMLGNQF